MAKPIWHQHKLDIVAALKLASKRKPRGVVARRIAIVFDGKRWYVRRIALIEHDILLDQHVYRCDEPISNDHRTLAEVPQVKAILRRALAKKDKR